MKDRRDELNSLIIFNLYRRTSMTSLRQHLIFIFGIRPRAANGAMVLAVVLMLTIAFMQPVQAQTFRVIYSFPVDDGPLGSTPAAGLTMDAAGNLYGTTEFGGGQSCYPDGGDFCGTVFKLTHKNSGWIYTRLYAFRGGDDGRSPLARVVLARTEVYTEQPRKVAIRTERFSSCNPQQPAVQPSSAHG
jgi:hypothetical protein